MYLCGRASGTHCLLTICRHLAGSGVRNTAFCLLKYLPYLVFVPCALTAGASLWWPGSLAHLEGIELYVIFFRMHFILISFGKSDSLF